MPALLDAIAAGPVVLDGGLGTHLETRGNSVASALWSAKLLRDRPDEVKAAHRDFFAAGARVATTCSYQVTYEGFASEGADRDEVDALLRSSVEIARRARSEAGLTPEQAWVAASIGPYGASPGQGTEYTGDYDLDVDGLRRWHRPRLEALAASGPDALLFETVPALEEVEAICRELAGSGAAALLSVTVGTGGALRTGASLTDVADWADRTQEIRAVGVNCASLRDADTAIRTLSERTAKPLIAYPNTGETWDPASRSWFGDAAPIDAYVEGWLDRGVRLIGGCCRVTTGDIERIAECVGRWATPSPR